MNSRLLQVAVVLLSIFNVTQSSHALVSPLGVAIVPPVQFPPERFSVAGARVGVWGAHYKVYGFDVGVVNTTSQMMGGVQVAGLFNYNKGETTAVGIQGAGIANSNVNKTTIIGAQVAGIVNSNRGESTLVGVGVAAANMTDHTKVGGLQAGLYNKARIVYGFQVGVVNMVDELHGFQIGLVNFHNKGVFAVSPILNFGF